MIDEERKLSELKDAAGKVLGDASTASNAFVQSKAGWLPTLKKYLPYFMGAVAILFVVGLMVR